MSKETIPITKTSVKKSQKEVASRTNGRRAPLEAEARDVRKKEKKSETAPPFSDEHLTLYFSRIHRDDLRYTAAWGRWSVWDGQRWKEDKTRAVFDKARALCREAAAELQERRAKKEAKGIDRSPSQITNAGTIAAIERLARSARCHAMEIEQWDCDLWALNTPGGTVNLNNGVLRAHAYADHITKITAATPGGACPMWLQFLNRITDGDADYQRFLQRMAGYALTGATREHALFFLYGTGANGKSVFLNTNCGVMGDYAKTAPVETFLASTTERHPTDLAALRGARLVSAFETEEGRYWAEAKIKHLTGGDRIPARFMRQDFFEYTPQFKLLIAGNNKPSLRSVDEAIRRRLHLIPFTVTIPEEERDKELFEKLRTEWGGILAWMIEGCLDWQSQGLNPPPIVLEATADYLSDQDAIGLWIDERCEVGPDHRGTVADLFENWKEWCCTNDEDPGSKKLFSQRLEKQGFWKKAWAEARGFVGIGLKDGSTVALPGIAI